MKRGLLKPAFLIALALPGLLMLADLTRGAVLAMDLLHPSGEMSARLLVLALLPGPLAGIFGTSRFLQGWLRIRRNLGVGAFCYALLHLVFYLIDSGELQPVIDELGLPSVWTGWLALLVMLPPAATSFDRAMRMLGRAKWKAWQRLAYAALALTLAHWLLLDWHWQPPLVHAAPVILAWLTLMLRRLAIGRQQERNFRS